jgi:hypothetical protein
VWDGLQNDLAAVNGTRDTIGKAWLAWMKKWAEERVEIASQEGIAVGYTGLQLLEALASWVPSGGLKGMGTEPASRFAELARWLQERIEQERGGTVTRDVHTHRLLMKQLRSRLGETLSLPLPLVFSAITMFMYDQCC